MGNINELKVYDSAVGILRRNFILLPGELFPFVSGEKN